MKLKSALILGTLLTLSTPVLASSEGGNGSGGGHGVGNELLDLFEARQIKKVNVNTDPRLKIARDLIARFEITVPRLARDMKDVMKKTWAFTSLQPSCEQTTSALATSAQMKEKACQNKGEVVLSEQWFTDAKVTQVNRDGLVVHELVRGVAMGVIAAKRKEATPPTERGLRIMTVAMLDGTDDKEIVRLLNQNDFNASYNYFKYQTPETAAILAEGRRAMAPRLSQLEAEYCGLTKTSDVRTFVALGEAAKSESTDILRRANAANQVNDLDGMLVNGSNDIDFQFLEFRQETMIDQAIAPYGIRRTTPKIPIGDLALLLQKSVCTPGGYRE